MQLIHAACPRTPRRDHGDRHGTQGELFRRIHHNWGERGTLARRRYARPGAHTMSKSPRKPDPKPVSEPSNDDQDQVAPLRTPQAARWTLLVLTIIALILLALIT